MLQKHEICLVLMAAGSSTRFQKMLPFEKKVKKQWLRLDSKPLWKKVLEDLMALDIFGEVVVGMDENEILYAQNFCDVKIVAGGKTRTQSLKKILEHVQSPYVFVTDVARWDIDRDLCLKLVSLCKDYDCVVPFISCVDTIYYKDKAINREEVKLIQTPQISQTSKLKIALDKEYTDESTAMLDHNFRVGFVQGSHKMQKLTSLEDLRALVNQGKYSPSENIVTGSGIDIHAFVEKKPMVLGGVTIESPFGFKAHSDGDVLLHALIDALLGAICGGDIGEWFPDTSKNYENIDSKILLEKIRAFVVSVGYEILHVDVSILAQTPKISPYKKQIQEKLAELLYMQKNQINIKATTAEGLGFVGRKEGVCVMVQATLKFIDYREIYASINY